MEFDEKLRSWAEGLHHLEAATELLIRAFSGRFASPANPWVVMEDGELWIDFPAIPDYIGGLSDAERRLLLLTASLGGGAPVDLSEVLPGMDRHNLELVLAAVSHAGGTHEHSTLEYNPDGTHSISRQTSLHPWPARREQVSHGRD